jgi:hypothetical protein
MKKLLFITCFCMASVSMMAQKAAENDGTYHEGAFAKGDVAISVASGFGVTYDYYGTYISLPALTLGADVGIINHAGPGNISVGGIFGYKRAFNRDDTYDATWTNLIIAARGIYHLTIINNDKFNPYAGVTTGIRINDYHDSFYSDGNNPNSYQNVYPVIGLFVGARYFFVPSFGGFVELGYDISVIRIGVSFKF